MRAAFLFAALLGHAHEVASEGCVSMIATASDAWCSSGCSATPDADECKEACKCTEGSCVSIFPLVDLANKWCDLTCGEGVDAPDPADCDEKTGYCRCPSREASDMY